MKWSIQGCRPWAGVPWNPQILTDHLTLSQPGGGGQIMPTKQILLTGTPGFSDLPTALALTNVKLNRQRRKSRKSNFLCDMGAGSIVQSSSKFSNRNSFLSNKETPTPGFGRLKRAGRPAKQPRRPALVCQRPLLPSVWASSQLAMCCNTQSM